MEKKLPPYGKVHLLNRTIFPDIYNPLYICIGKNAMRDAKLNFEQGVHVLAVHPNTSFDNYKWPVGNHRVTIYDTHTKEKDYDQFAKLLYAYGAKEVWLFTRWLYKPIEKDLNHE